MYAMLVTPCFTSTATARPHSNDNAMIRRRKLAEVRSLLSEIAQVAPARGQKRAIGLPEGLDAALTAWASGRTHRA